MPRVQLSHLYEVIYLLNLKKKMLALGLSLYLSTGMAAAASLPPTLPLSEVYPGMEGTAYTVVDETGEILPFHVDIVGTFEEGSSTNRIMAKASGPVVERTGGALQGMSGSPVYVDGSLVGALSAGIKGMSLYTFFITPIDEMLPIWDMPDYKAVHLKKDEKEKEAEAATEGEEKAGEGEPQQGGESRAKLEKEALPELAEEKAQDHGKKPLKKAKGKDAEKVKESQDGKGSGKEKSAAAKDSATEKKPAEAGKKHADAAKKPAETGKKPADAEKKPAETGKKPKDAEKKRRKLPMQQSSLR